MSIVIPSHQGQRSISKICADTSVFACVIVRLSFLQVALDCKPLSHPTGTTLMVFTTPLLDKPAPGWKHDLPGPNELPSTEPYPPVLSNPPNSVDDVYLELARATMRVGRPACSAGSSAKATFRAGQILTRTGAVIGAVTGLCLLISMCRAVPPRQKRCFTACSCSKRRSGAPERSSGKAKGLKT